MKQCNTLESWCLMYVWCLVMKFQGSNWESWKESLTENWMGEISAADGKPLLMKTLFGTLLVPHMDNSPLEKLYAKKKLWAKTKDLEMISLQIKTEAPQQQQRHWQFSKKNCNLTKQGEPINSWFMWINRRSIWQKHTWCDRWNPGAASAQIIGGQCTLWGIWPLNALHEHAPYVLHVPCDHWLLVSD